MDVDIMYLILMEELMEYGGPKWTRGLVMQMVAGELLLFHTKAKFGD